VAGGYGMNSRRVLWLLAGLLVGVSVLGLAHPAPAEPRARAAAPAGLSAGEWQSIVAQIARPHGLEAAPGPPLTVDPIAQQAYLKASNTDANDQFGYSVAISGDTVVVGAHFEASATAGVNGNQADNSAAIAGAAYVFV